MLFSKDCNISIVGYYSAPSARALALALANLYSAATTARAHLETGASLCGQIHGIYRYLYVRELAFHNRFPEATSTTTATATTAAWASCGRSISHSFIVVELGSYVSFVRVQGLLRLFRDYCTAPYLRGGLHSSLSRARLRIS